MMVEVTGTSLDVLPLQGLIKVSDLIFYDGPLLSHYKSHNEENYLFYWVDSDELYNRWLLVRVTIERLQAYMHKLIPLYDLIKQPADGFLYKLDISQNLNYENIIFLVPANIPSDYLPSKSSTYVFEPFMEDVDLTYYSKKNNTGVLQAYFKNSSKIPYNQISLDIFGPAMNALNELNLGLGKAYTKHRIETAPKDKNNKPIVDKNALRQNTALLYFGQAGGSFSALFKSASDKIPIEGFSSEVDDYIDYFMNFISSSEDYEALSKFVESVDKKIVTSYKGLLNTVIKSKLRFYLRYENTLTNVSRKQDLNYSKAIRILSVIEKLEYNEMIEISIIGRFTAINLKTGTYEFDDIDDSEITSKGKLDKTRYEVASQISFKKIYTVLIERRESKQAGNKKPKIEDLLISFIEVKDTELG